MSLAIEIPAVVSDYKTWGLKDTSPIQVIPLAPDQIAEMTKVAASLVNLSGYQLAAAGSVKHYQREHFPSANIGLLRFTPSGTSNLQSEHISLTFDLDKRVLMGLTRMQRQVVGAQADDVPHAVVFKIKCARFNFCRCGVTYNT
jgi:hypothetical protein